MLYARRRQLAWLFVLVLAMELALLCCASAHLSDHRCCGEDTCLICACVRGGLRKVALAAPALLALFALMALACSGGAMRLFTGLDSPIARKVRLND